MVKVLVLGSTGMLGSQVMKTLKEKGHDVKGTARNASPIWFETEPGQVEFDAYGDDVVRLIPMLDWSDYVINCIGVIKPFINDYMAASIRVNSIFPFPKSKLKNFSFALIIVLEISISNQRGRE